ncbi:hypothetical protein ATANTOWER_023136 [Ataeniobius toweri]|uniref:Kinase suppressor RAS 1 N-terminal helical hairpin domain-containing protein n=1 Tax=Ataeniobius toweri TaxID=208326 RepID=A0ABU7C046_9TELE|nr:hypothetical protein [Ataeniobius toweri]
MDSVSTNGGKMVESDEQQPERHSGGGAAMAALHQCELIQNMIDISISSLQGLRTKCAASNDLTQQEIRTLEVKRAPRMCWCHKKLSGLNCGVMMQRRYVRLSTGCKRHYVSELSRFYRSQCYYRVDVLRLKGKNSNCYSKRIHFL